MLSHNKNYLHDPSRATKNADRDVFKVPMKIGNVYEQYIGTTLWNGLRQYTQEAIFILSIFELKTIISPSYSVYKEF